MSKEIDQLLSTLTAEEQKAESAVHQWQQKLDEVRAKRLAVETTAELLKNDSMALPLNGSTKYANMGMSEAVQDCVKNSADSTGLTRAEVMKRLRDHGFTYSGKPQNFYSAVSIALTRLADGGKLKVLNNDGGPARFILS